MQASRISSRHVWVAITSVVMALSTFSSHAAQDFSAVHASALKGDYQAQRNIAFGYAQMPYKGQDLNPLLACAWRTVIIHSGSPRVDVTDTGNRDLYCGRLSTTEADAARAQARSLFSRIYKTSAPF